MSFFASCTADEGTRGCVLDYLRYDGNDNHEAHDDQAFGKR